MNYEQMHYEILDEITWDDPVTPIADTVQPVIDPNGWHWYPDANGNLFTLYFDGDGNECMMWRLNDDGTFYWRCAGVAYTCRDIGIEGRRGIFFENLLVGTMILDEDLTVDWLPETFIPDNQIDFIHHINNINVNNINDINDNNDNNDNNNINDITDIDEDSDDYDP